MGEANDKQLVVLHDGRRVAVVSQGRDGRLSLAYDDDWRRSPQAVPLSLSLPLTARTHDDTAVRAYLWGLLPDSERVLERWARDYQVSARNPFALLQHVGEDCAGAAQFVSPDRVDMMLAGEGGVEWISEDNIAERLRTLRRDPTSWHLARTGQFSLAGAQAKTALHHDPASGRWGDPWGSTPTTHIIKPAITGFDEHDLNERLCLQAARHAGLTVASSKVTTFGEERAIVIERYDRMPAAGGKSLRIHQEDMCQALGVPPTQKYQSEGGPTPEQIVELLRREVQPRGRSEIEIGRFVDALAFNWLVAGTDAHGKNYSILLAGGQVRLAPLYDLASVLPYDDMYLPKLRLAMRIGGEYRIERISGRHWRRFAGDNGLDPESTIERIDQLAARVPPSFAAAAADESIRRLESPLPPLLTQRVSALVEHCRRVLAHD
ncbi:serine/threonine-protein kinase HipA [Micromonospora viridifaciens]|uniref:Serine/threonine-protein kinase HipA n=1 Tax=Micromonospora viridifaciens TaxID=1881 RepID=A0A1C4VYT4_MICVI|nr:type II toxin-antitoxin system HipA family toxin [Micromonospora viridifaciens]SCE88889.1 serine/threonine-protein kinase HipA [Micromonospora viridifaciens]